MNNSFQTEINLLLESNKEKKFYFDNFDFDSNKSNNENRRK